MNSTPRTESTTLDPRDARAIQLIESGAVSLVFGRTWATVKGSGKASYRASRDGCSCPDWAKRGEQIGACKHMRSVKALCDAIRLLRAEAKQAGRTRLPAHLARALANGAAEKRRQAERLADLSDDLFGAA